MSQKVLNETQMRKYVEEQVRAALVNEQKESTLLKESIDEVLSENMTDEGVMDWLKTLIGNSLGKNGNNPAGPNISMEGIVGAILGRFMAPVLGKLLAKIGIDPNGAIGSVIVKAASTAGGFGLGQLVDKKWDPIGLGNGGVLGLGKKN